MSEVTSAKPWSDIYTAMKAAGESPDRIEEARSIYWHEETLPRMVDAREPLTRITDAKQRFFTGEFDPGYRPPPPPKAEPAPPGLLGRVSRVGEGLGEAAMLAVNRAGRGLAGTGALAVGAAERGLANLLTGPGMRTDILGGPQGVGWLSGQGSPGGVEGLLTEALAGPTTSGEPLGPGYRLAAKLLVRESPPLVSRELRTSPVPQHPVRTRPTPEALAQMTDYPPLTVGSPEEKARIRRQRAARNAEVLRQIELARVKPAIGPAQLVGPASVFDPMTGTRQTLPPAGATTPAPSPLSQAASSLRAGAARTDQYLQQTLKPLPIERTILQARQAREAHGERTWLGILSQDIADQAAGFGVLIGTAGTLGGGAEVAIPGLAGGGKATLVGRLASQAINSIRTGLLAAGETPGTFGDKARAGAYTGAAAATVMFSGFVAPASMPAWGRLALVKGVDSVMNEGVWLAGAYNSLQQDIAQHGGTILTHPLFWSNTIVNILQSAFTEPHSTAIARNVARYLQQHGMPNAAEVAGRIVDDAAQRVNEQAAVVKPVFEVLEKTTQVGEQARQMQMNRLAKAAGSVLEARTVEERQIAERARQAVESTGLRWGAPPTHEELLDRANAARDAGLDALSTYYARRAAAKTVVSVKGAFYPEPIKSVERLTELGEALKAEVEARVGHKLPSIAWVLKTDPRTITAHGKARLRHHLTVGAGDTITVYRPEHWRPAGEFEAGRVSLLGKSTGEYEPLVGGKTWTTETLSKLATYLNTEEGIQSVILHELFEVAVPFPGRQSRLRHTGIYNIQASLEEELLSRRQSALEVEGITPPRVEVQPEAQPEPAAEPQVHPRGQPGGSESGLRLTRYVEAGTVPFDWTKPQGVYTSPASGDSIHADLGPPVEAVLSPQAKVLRLVDTRDVILRRGATSSGAGVYAVRTLLEPDQFAELTVMRKADLAAWANSRWPTYDWSRMYDPQEILEGIGGRLAADAGYDAVELQDRINPGATEVALLNPAVVSMARVPQKAAGAEGVAQPSQVGPSPTEKIPSYTRARGETLFSIPPNTDPIQRALLERANDAMGKRIAPLIAKAMRFVYGREQFNQTPEINRIFRQYKDAPDIKTTQALMEYFTHNLTTPEEHMAMRALLAGDETFDQVQSRLPPEARVRATPENIQAFQEVMRRATLDNAVLGLPYHEPYAKEGGKPYFPRPYLPRKGVKGGGVSFGGELYNVATTKGEGARTRHAKMIHWVAMETHPDGTREYLQGFDTEDQAYKWTLAELDAHPTRNIEVVPPASPEMELAYGLISNLQEIQRRGVGPAINLRDKVLFYSDMAQAFLDGGDTLIRAKPDAGFAHTMRSAGLLEGLPEYAQKGVTAADQPLGRVIDMYVRDDIYADMTLFLKGTWLRQILGGLENIAVKDLGIQKARGLARTGVFAERVAHMGRTVWSPIRHLKQIFENEMMPLLFDTPYFTSLPLRLPRILATYGEFVAGKTPTGKVWDAFVAEGFPESTMAKWVVSGGEERPLPTPTNTPFASTVGKVWSSLEATNREAQHAYSSMDLAYKWDYFNHLVNKGMAIKEASAEVRGMYMDFTNLPPLVRNVGSMVPFAPSVTYNFSRIFSYQLSKRPVTTALRLAFLGASYGLGRGVLVKHYVPDERERKFLKLWEIPIGRRDDGRLITLNLSWLIPCMDTFNPIPWQAPDMPSAVTSIVPFIAKPATMIVAQRGPWGREPYEEADPAFTKWRKSIIGAHEVLLPALVQQPLAIYRSLAKEEERRTPWWQITTAGAIRARDPKRDRQMALLHYQRLIGDVEQWPRNAALRGATPEEVARVARKARNRIATLVKQMGEI